MPHLSENFPCKSIRTFFNNPAKNQTKKQTQHNKEKNTQTHTESEKTNITVTAHNVCMILF